jgi:isocitrate/isopropylmalate dehydrogenase
MKAYNIAVIGGDGTGPEVIREAIKVLEAAGQRFEIKFNFTYYDLGGERYLRTQEALPDSVVEELRGGTAQVPGDPAWGHRPSGGQAGHPGKGHPAAAAIRAGTIHQPAAGEAL